MSSGLETFVDWFAGIRGFRIGAEKNGLRCVASCDNDPWARQTYRSRFGREPEFNDARDVNAGEVPDHDLFCGGFPCQSFSIAGKRRGFADARGTLFFEICRVLEARRPNYVLLENVKGLLSAPMVGEDGKAIPETAGWVFYRMLESLGDMGYAVQWQVLNVRHWLPQSRERVYILCSAGGVPTPEVFPLFDAAGEVDGNPRGAGGPIGKVHTHQGGRVYGPNSIAPTIDTGKGPYLDTGKGLRLATPVERERLMGFPDDWTEGVSDQQRYRQTGNAVSPRVVDAIVSVLVECHANKGARV
jgi:DNA (cytosine-5)-methyltransferase 1